MERLREHARPLILPCCLGEQCVPTALALSPYIPQAELCSPPDTPRRPRRLSFARAVEYLLYSPAAFSIALIRQSTFPFGHAEAWRA